MRHVWIALLLLLLTAYLGSGVWSPATSEAQFEPPVATVVRASVNTTPPVSAAAYAVIDMETGTVLFSHNAEPRLPIASITKLFTAVAVQDTYALDDAIVLQESDLVAYGNAGKLAAGQEYAYRELLLPLLLSSSNDAAYALRRQGAGEALLRTMEEVAARGGAPEAQFADASGLSDANQVSALGLAHWLQDSYQTHPGVYDMTRVGQYVGPYLGWQNNSPFMELAGYRGGKHGYTTAAGRTAAAVFTETVDGAEYEFGYVLLGSADLVNDMTALRTHVQRSVEWR